MPELKPCPFEHHYPHQPAQVLQVDTVLNDGVFRYAVFCLHCDARGPVREARAAAITAWNRRSTPDSPDDSALRLGKAVIDGLHQHPSWPAWTDLEILDAYLGSSLLMWPINAFFQAIRKVVADNYPGKPESEEEKA